MSNTPAPVTQAPRRRVSRLAIAASVLAVSSLIMDWAGLIHRVDFWKWVFLVDGLATLAAGIAAACVVRATQRRWTADHLMAWASIAVGAFAVIVMPGTCSAGENAKRANCKSNLRQIGLALHIYTDDSDGQFPPSFKELYPKYIDNHKIFRCPSERSATTEDFAGDKITAKSSDYSYFPGLSPTMLPDFIVAYDKSPDNHRKQGYEGGRNVLFVDAHVEWWPASREAEFQKLLAEQPALVENWRKARKEVEKRP